ncbi:hypothetical protein C3B56_00066 [Candidatus Annandia adelgestsuga]|uniref:Transcription termination factor Rho n=1 Tax=Candidatus Annandia adelgestsuga TaxID=1302411 RepID=A0A3Q9CLS4_9ENTR|nr:transcription termination factor Rho [Candidatus Annandia adelgestsuga]AZP36187.1 hypothetical protein C3B56_00066 [Candidatus Annandia adelgestsuga]
MINFINIIKCKKIEKIINIVININYKTVKFFPRYIIIFFMLKFNVKFGILMSVNGIIEIINMNFGFLRSIYNNYYSGVNDVYVSLNIIKIFNLKTGDKIIGKIIPPINYERYFSLININIINNILPIRNKKRISFENLVPLYANSRLFMEIKKKKIKKDITSRILDLITPIGKGQRGLIVAPPKAGKTLLIQNIAKSISYNYKNHILIVLLIDERPEEVTEMKKIIKGEVLYSTFDEPSYKHIQIAEIIIEKAKRMVENSNNVIILLDSLTRLARAYNSILPTSGRTLTGGIDSNALYRPKRFFGSARNLQEGGSLTIIATVLIETGSKMDEVIYEEFKGTGNMELHLSRKMSNKRIFPSIDYIKSGTRKEELLVNYYELKKMWFLRKLLGMMDKYNSMKFLIKQLIKSKNNYFFLKNMNLYL